MHALRVEKAGKKIIQGKKPPPTEDTFILHLRRCAYQLLIWRRAFLPVATLPNATAFGYERCSDGIHLQPPMMNQFPAARNWSMILCVTAGQTHVQQTVPAWTVHGPPCTGACACETAADGAADGVEICTNALTLAAYEARADSVVEL